jgi:hypothetical protein
MLIITLVVETDEILSAESEKALKNLLPAEDSGFSDGSHFFRYFTVNDNTDQETLTITVMKIRGVHSAYFKLRGMPPQ